MRICNSTVIGTAVRGALLPSVMVIVVAAGGWGATASEI
jgi:hypothetical protein